MGGERCEHQELAEAAMTEGEMGAERGGDWEQKEALAQLNPPRCLCLPRVLGLGLGFGLLMLMLIYPREVYELCGKHLVRLWRRH